MNRKGKTFSSIISLLLTLSVIALLMFSGPAKAISVGFTQTPIDSFTYEYTAYVDVHSPDFVKLNLIIIEANTDELNTTCAYNLNNQEYNSTFSSGNTPLCTEAISIIDFVNNATYENSMAGGKGYGYGSNNTASGIINMSWNPGGGYGYTEGEGSDVYSEIATNGEIMIQFTLSTNATIGDNPILSPDTTYTVNVGVAGLTPGNNAIQFTYKAQSTEQFTASAIDFEALFNEIHDNLLAENIDTNIDECGLTPTNCEGLWFAKLDDDNVTYIGNLSFSGSLDLTDNDTVALLQSLEEKLTMQVGTIGLDASAAQDLQDAGATLTMFNLPYSETPNIRIFDEDGAEVIEDILDNIVYESGNGTLTFDTDHFTTFQTEEVQYYEEEVFVDSEYAEVNINSSTMDINSTITVAQGVKEVTLDLSDLLEGEDDKSVVMSGSIEAEINTSDGIIIIQFPNDINITGDSEWDGTLTLPKIESVDAVTPEADSGYDIDSTDLVIYVGSSTSNLTFDKAVRLLLPGMKRKSVGFQQSGGSFTPITESCSADTQAAGDEEADCKINSGDDLAVWTDHFTYFAAYTQSRESSGTGGTSNSDEITVLLDPSQSFSYQALYAGTRDMVLTNVNIPFSKISLSTNSRLYDVIVKITAKSAPSVLYAGKLYKYVQVDHQSIPDASINAAKISFKVPKSWLTTNDLSRDSIKLLRYTTQWDPLTTTVTSEDSMFVYYEALSPGLSLFVIAQPSAEAPIPPVVNAPSPVPVTGEAVNTEKTESGITDVKTTAQSTKTDVTPMTRFIISAIALIVLVLIIYFLYKRNND